MANLFLFGFLAFCFFSMTTLSQLGVPGIKDFLLVGVCTESDTPHCLYRLFSLYWCFWYIVLLNDCTDLRSKKRTHWSIPPEILCLLFGTYTYWFYWLWEKRLKRCCYWDILFTGLLHTIKRNFVAPCLELYNNRKWIRESHKEGAWMAISQQSSYDVH